MSSILVIHGPNLNLLGTREPDVYGSETLADINERLMAQTKQHKLTLEAIQSNAEHVLIEKIHQAKHDNTQFIIINPAAFTHTSVAIRDAILAVNIPFIEVHISNVHAREAFRHHSYFSDIAIGVICGLGSQGYDAALNKAMSLIPSKQ